MWDGARLRCILCAGLAGLCANFARADDGSFLFEAASPHPYTAAYLGNGAIGVVTAPLGTTPTNCFLAGVYDATSGDVPRIASAPAWNEVDVFNGSRWLNAESSSFPDIAQYRQTLDMFNGVLRTTFKWADGDRSMEVDAEELVSRDDAILAGTRVTIMPEFAGAIAVRFPFRNWPPPHRYGLAKIRKLEGDAARNPWAIWYPGRLDVVKLDVERPGRGTLISAGLRTPGDGPKVGEAIAIDWTGTPQAETHKSADAIECQIHFDVQPGKRYTFEKFASIVTSSTSTDPSGIATQMAFAAREAGWQRLVAASEAAWRKLWDSDIIIDGNPTLQRTIHSMLFYLLGSTREGLSMSTPPMGLNSSGYFGHIFWDADTYMFPPLVILHPELARPMVGFRARTLEAARQNARRNGFQGAMFPWEAGPDGAETTPRFAFQNATSENHVNGDVAVAAWQYWLATADRKWLELEGWPIIRDTADFWVSRVNYNADRDRYEIGNVVAVRESDIGVSNDAYTNAVAKMNLELAIAASDELHVEAHSRWREVAEKMYLPDSDSCLLRFPLEHSYSREQIRQVIQGFLPEVERRETGAMMGTEFYPILAAQIGDRALIGRLLDPLVTPYLRAPFQVIAETPDNQNTNFITGAGAFLQQFVFGYTGLRLGEGGLERKFRPVLPPGVERLTLKNITVRNNRERLTFESSVR